MQRPIIYRTVSFTDLESVGYQIYLTVDGDTLSVNKVTKHGQTIKVTDLFKALKFLGLRINHNLSFESKCEHVTISGKRTNNFRVVGEERGDDEWLKSGFASDEAKMNSSGMKDMVSHIQRMSRGGDRS